MPSDKFSTRDKSSGSPAPDTHPLPNDDGMVWAFHYPPNAAPEPLTGLERQREGWVWGHFDLVHPQSVPVIDACADLPRFAKDVLTGHDEALRLVSEGDVIAGILPGFLRGEGEDQELVYWRFALQPDMLVTSRRAPVRSLTASWQAALSGHAPGAPQVLVDEAVSSFAQDMRRKVATLARELDPVEDALLSYRRERIPGRLGATIGRVRRDATRLKRALDPVVRLMDDDVDELPQWAVGWTHDTAHRQTHAAMDDLHALQDRARSLQDELTAKQADETNRRLYIVSVVTTLVMPATFLTGFFGMNTGGMFMNQFPHGTLVATGLCVLVLAATWLAMRWRKLL